jgi:hypothetical protein
VRRLLAITKHELLSLKVIDVPNLDKALALVEGSLRHAVGAVACEIRPLVETPYEPAVLEVVRRDQSPTSARDVLPCCSFRLLGRGVRNQPMVEFVLTFVVGWR